MLFCGPATLILLVALGARAVDVNIDRYDGCGKPKIKPDIGINSTVNVVGGKEAIPHSWPWMVGLHFVQDLSTGEYVFQCAGTLVGKRWILTTAACIDSNERLNLERWLVTVGAHDLSSGRTKTARMRRMIKHPKYTEYRRGNDIALIQLQTEIEYFSNIIPLCLPKADFEPETGTVCVTTGWGSSDNTTDKLQEMVLPIASEYACKAAYGRHIPENTICAGYAHETDLKGPCRADKGGPLACLDAAGIWQLIGIASMTQDCSEDETSKPALYTLVDRFLGWIADVTLSTPCNKM